MIDRLTLVIIVLGLIALVCLSGVIYLAAANPARSIPDVLVATTGAAVGSLGSLLAASLSSERRADRITG